MEASPNRFVRLAAPLNIPEILSMVLSYLPYKEVKTARLVSRFWNEVASPISLKHSPPIRLYLHPEDVEKQSHILHSFSPALHNKLEVFILPHKPMPNNMTTCDNPDLERVIEATTGIEKDLYEQQEWLEEKLAIVKRKIENYKLANSSHDHEQSAKQFLTGVAKLLKLHGNHIKEVKITKSCNWMQTFERSTELNKQRSVGQLLRFTPNIVNLSLDLEIFDFDFFKPSFIIQKPDKVLTSLKELTVKLRFRKLDTHNNIRACTKKLEYWAKRLFNWTPNVETLHLVNDDRPAFTSILLRVLHRHPEFLPNLECIGLHNHLNRATLKYFIRLDRALKRIHFTDYEINFVNGITLQGIEEILTNQANTIEVLKIGLMVEPGETKQLKLPDLPRLKELSMNYKVNVEDYIKQDYSDPTEVIPRLKRKDYELQLPVSQGVFSSYYLVPKVFERVNLHRLFRNESAFAQKFPLLDTLELTYDIGYKKSVYNLIFLEGKHFPQIKKLTVDYPEKGTELYDQWIEKLVEMFPNVKHYPLNAPQEFEYN